VYAAAAAAVEALEEAVAVLFPFFNSGFTSTSTGIESLMIVICYV
jgi:hypothetical protein